MKYERKNLLPTAQVPGQFLPARVCCVVCGWDNQQTAPGRLIEHASGGYRRLGRQAGASKFWVGREAEG